VHPWQYTSPPQAKEIRASVAKLFVHSWQYTSPPQAKEIRVFVAIPIRGNKLFGFIVGNSFTTR
jgi:hypothetical protein